jgi:hypothetical protein
MNKLKSFEVELMFQGKTNLICVDAESKENAIEVAKNIFEDFPQKEDISFGEVLDIEHTFDGSKHTFVTKSFGEFTIEKDMSPKGEKAVKVSFYCCENKCSLVSKSFGFQDHLSEDEKEEQFNKMNGHEAFGLVEMAREKNPVEKLIRALAAELAE